MENWTPLQDLRKSKYSKGGKEDEASERLKFWGTSDAIEKRVSQLPDAEGQEETLLTSRFQGPSPRSDMGQELSGSTENSSNSGGPWKTLRERLTAGPRTPAEGDFTLKGRGFLQQGEREGFPEESVQKEQSGSRRGGNVLQMRTRSRPPRGHIMKGSKSSVQFSRVWLFVTPWAAAPQASLSIANSRSLLKLMSIELVMPSNHLILCHPLLLLPSIFPSIRVFSSESVLPIRWPKYWNFNFSISPSNEYSGLISFRIDWFDLLAVQGTIKSLLQHHSSKASFLSIQLALSSNSHIHTWLLEKP